MKMKTQQSLQDILKVVLGGKSIALCAYVKKSEGSPIHDLMRKLKTGKTRTNQPNPSPLESNIKTRAETSDIETEKQYKEPMSL